MNILPRFTTNTSKIDPIQQIEEDLIREEALEGGQLFGAIPKGHTRQFFCLDEHTWVWHESWSDSSGSHNVVTRYEVRPNGIFKVQNGGTYQSLTESEFNNLLRAARLYAKQIIPRYQSALSA